MTSPREPQQEGPRPLQLTEQDVNDALSAEIASTDSVHYSVEAITKLLNATLAGHAGTFRCPICELDQPHKHRTEEIEAAELRSLSGQPSVPSPEQPDKALPDMAWGFAFATLAPSCVMEGPPPEWYKLFAIFEPAPSTELPDAASKLFRAPSTPEEWDALAANLKASLPELEAALARIERASKVSAETMRKVVDV